MKEIKLRVIEDGLVDVPVHEEHRRGRNWCATVEPNPKAPGGMDRNFWSKARGELFHYIVPPNLHPPCVIEFGADYYSLAGNKRPNRWYGVLIEQDKRHLVLTECSSAAEAFSLAHDLIHTTSDDGPPDEDSKS